MKRVHEYGGIGAPRRGQACATRRKRSKRASTASSPCARARAGTRALESVRARERDAAHSRRDRSCSPARSRTATACSRRRRWAATPPTSARASSRRRNRSRSTATSRCSSSATPRDIVYTPFFSGVHGSYLKPSIRTPGLDPDNLPGPRRRQAQVPLARRAAEDVEGHLGRGPGRGQHRSTMPTGAELVDRLESEYHAARQRIGLTNGEVKK